MSGAANSFKFAVTARWIPEKSDAGQQFTSFRYWLTSDLGVGFDYRPLIDQVSFNATYRLISEDPNGWRPAVLLGTSFDDFTIDGQAVESRSYFATVSKALPDYKFLGITPLRMWELYGSPRGTNSDPLLVSILHTKKHPS